VDDHDYGRLLVLGHYGEPRLAGVQKMLDERAVRRAFEVVEAPEGLPELTEDVRGVLVMGGLMGVPEIDEMPWMQDEVELLRRAHEQGIPLLGICLGAQMLAHALGGKVTRRATPQVGLFNLARSPEGIEDAIFGGFPDGGRVVLVNKDEVTNLPPGAVVMTAAASGPEASGTPAWRLGETTYAVQFHPEIDPDLLQFWRDQGFDEGIVNAGVDPTQFLEQVTTEARFLRAVGLALVGRWIDVVVGKGDPSPRKHRKAG
jgi:GMP synthase (glutamine-hydrolysing)